MRDGGGAERALPHPADAHHGPLGAQGLHTHPAQAAGHAQAALRPGQAQVGQGLARESLSLSLSLSLLDVLLLGGAGVLNLWVARPRSGSPSPSK